MWSTMHGSFSVGPKHPLTSGLIDMGVSVFSRDGRVSMFWIVLGEVSQTSSNYWSN